MKKILFLLSLLTLPFSAMAQSKPERAPDAYIKKTAERFFPNLCKDSLEGLMNDVYDCYQHTKNNDPQYLQCMIGDTYVFAAVFKANQKAAALGRPIPFNVPFFSQEKWAERTGDLIRIPQLSGYILGERTPYLEKSTKQFIDDINIMYADKNNVCK
ncbi:hypothetical protein [Commensalibacter papalotli (ex Servin-Garciduenas et al. 2014)]|uniref:Uncharacterized protein n=1 Tax=Commensalibacter papalotli (ex Servin-Garciduenas et al. 2014) TaxID=1208583 RepID=W7DW07_9PROT|nr:hypothetical protein [Commensalibacter papalotli (ex Servin-Garciduenas et al. 2014)]EUK19250.1 hypothetical protein COMX_05850 [Commensalibacter papalotli (ex Servin-Garciduenas et al. 2014)]